MSDTESVIQLPSSHLPGEREAEADSQGPLTSLFEGIPKGFEVLGVGEAPMTDQSRKPVCVDDSSSQEGAMSPASAIQNRFGLPFIHPFIWEKSIACFPPGQTSRLFSDFQRPRHPCSGSSNSHRSSILQFTQIPY